MSDIKNADTKAVLAAVPASGEKADDVATIAARAGIAAWKASNAISILKTVYRGTIAEITVKKAGHLYCRTPEGDRQVGGGR